MNNGYFMGYDMLVQFLSIADVSNRKIEPTGNTISFDAVAGLDSLSINKKMVIDNNHIYFPADENCGLHVIRYSDKSDISNWLLK